VPRAAEVQAPATLRFRRPDGQPLPEVPPAAMEGGDAVTMLRAHHDTLGLRLDARTTCPGWLGEPLNVGWAIDVLHPRAKRAPKPEGAPTSLDHSGIGR
jgi:hypothetical protein